MIHDFPELASYLPAPFRLVVHEQAVSTNDEVRALAVSGEAGGLVLLALTQTGGRGRRGSTWVSTAGDSLAFSILIRPQEQKALWPRLALATGLAVAEALESFGPATGIKWPNDVWIKGRKVAGILVEAGADFVIVGIGLNVNTRCFPLEIADIATSLGLETGSSHSLSEVLGEVIRRFALRHLQIGTEFNEMLDSVRQRCVLTGHHVSLTVSGSTRTGRVEGIAPGGELMLRTATGLENLIQADEVRFSGNTKES